jgi:methylmalonyl-CoA mutase C-terminal domain/subunit
MEAIYTGLRQTPEMIVAAAVQEDVDAIGLSVLSGAHLELFTTVQRLMRERGLDDVVLFGGGIIPRADAEALRQQGVAAIFGPGSSLAAIIAFIRGAVRPERAA